ncbi:cystathionine beta-lyase [Streptococcus cameli]
MEMIDLALKYGGFTSMDKVYLERVLKDLNKEQQLLFLTPPPSVINAYFAEIYQKQNPQAATDYYLELATACDLFQEYPDFSEEKPFVRLNLSGKAFGFTFVNESGLARVFSEKQEEISSELLFEVAQIFPHFCVYEKDQALYMETMDFQDQEWTAIAQDRFLITNLAENDHYVRISGLNQEEVMEAAQQYRSDTVYIQWSGNQAIVYCKK